MKGSGLEPGDIDHTFDTAIHCCISTTGFGRAGSELNRPEF